MASETRKEMMGGLVTVAGAVTLVQQEDSLRPPTLKPRSRGDLGEAPRNGRRRKVSGSPARVLRWPPAMGERRKIVRVWRNIAMTVLQQNRLGFRLVPLLVDYAIAGDGIVFATNKTLAKEGGRCHEKTIQRDVANFVEVGLLIVDYGWRKNRKGDFVRTRNMRLAVPEAYSGEVPCGEIDDDVADTDHGCPYLQPFNRTAVVYIPPDTCGPINGNTNDAVRAGDDEAA